MTINKNLICTLLAVGSLFGAYGQRFYAGNGVPSQPLNEKTNLTVLNARHGGRFSFSFVGKENGFHTGLMGYDNDALRDVLSSVVVGGKEYGLRTGVLPPNAQLMQNQKISLGLTGMEISGEQKGQFEYSMAVVSPFTPADSLGDVAAIKTQILPAYQLLFHLKNTTKSPQTYTLRFGLRAIPYDIDKQVTMSWWRINKPSEVLYFKDGSAGDLKSIVAVSGRQKGLKHFEVMGYHGLQFTVTLPAGAELQEKLIYAGHHQAKVMNHLPANKPLHYFYTHYWKSLDEVLATAWANHEADLKKTAQFERFLSESKATPEEKWVSAITFHSDLANSFLVQKEEGKPLYYLMEGRFRHFNTVDVAQETEIVSLFNPWRLKMQLEMWTDYIATKEVMVPSTRRHNGVTENMEGISATELGPFLYHDVGNFPYIYAAEGYEFGPVMPIEENSVFTGLLYLYWKMTGDDAFVKRHLGLVAVLMESMINRDSDGSGIADYGVGWSSYDVSDAIKRSPENVYLGVKQMAAYEMAAEMLEALPQKAKLAKTTPLKTHDEDGNSINGNGKSQFEKDLIDNTYLRKKQAEKLRAEAKLILNTLKQAKKTYGYIPVSLEKGFEGWNQHSIVIPEGLFLPGLANCPSPLLKEAASELKSSFQTALEKSRTPYGIKLSSDEDPTWFSKVMLADAVAFYWFGLDQSNAHYTYNWNKNNNQAYQDGAFSLTKEWPGNWYPRGVSSLPYLWRKKTSNLKELRSYIKQLK